MENGFYRFRSPAVHVESGHRDTISQFVDRRTQPGSWTGKIGSYLPSAVPRPVSLFSSFLLFSRNCLVEWRLCSSRSWYISHFSTPSSFLANVRSSLSARFSSHLFDGGDGKMREGVERDAEIGESCSLGK